MDYLHRYYANVMALIQQAQGRKIDALLMATFTEEHEAEQARQVEIQELNDLWNKP